MTQQFELAFNTTSNMDKMMTNSQSSSSKSYSSSDNMFGDYLNNANKTYTDNSKTSENTQKQTVLDKKDSKNDYSKNNVVKSETKTEYSDNKQVIYDEETETSNIELNNQSLNISDVKEDLNKDLNLAEDKTIVDKDVIAQTVVGQELEQIVSQQELEDVLQGSIINASLSNSQSVSKADVEKLEKTLSIEMLDENELPVEAVKSGISFSNLDTDLAKDVDLTNVDMNILDNAKEVKQLSKEEIVSALYSSKTNENATNLNSNDVDVKAVEQGNINLKVDDMPKVVVEHSEIKTTKDEILNDIKFKDDTKDTVINEKETVADVKNEDILNLKIERSENNEISIDDLKTQIANDVNMTENLSVNESVNANEIVQNQQKSIQTDKVQVLKDEINTAKQENAFETISSQADKTVEDKKVDDKFAKTNVKADETMEIKDDVSGIEFVSKKEDKVVDNKVVDEKSIVKEKVDNVKIQVEDNVKVVNNAQNTQDSAKIEKANETMNKAGLTTKTLQEMNGRVTEIEDAQTSSNFGGTSSQEMMMRDMLTENATSATAEAKTTVDFAQSLNKTVNAQQTQHAQQNNQDVQDIDILDQIRTKLTANSKNGMQKITIGLTPESLGKVSVEIVKGQNGISAQILADNAQAKEILDKNLDGLKSVLQSQGVNVNNVNVKVAEAGRSSDSNNNMFQENDGQFDSNQGNGNSRNSDESNHERHSDFEFIQNNAIMQETSDEPEDIITRTAQAEKTVSIKAGLGNVNYKL